VSYQDVVVDGVLVRGQRECASRWAAISKVLAKYDRRFTVLDLGASEGYFSLRAASEFDCVAVMIEGGKQLLSLCSENVGLDTILLQRRVSIRDLEQLATCEHFDVVLALNVLHHFVEPERVVRAVMSLGDHTIIETPAPDDSGACGQAVIPELHKLLADRGGDLIATTRSHVSDTYRPMWLFDTPKRTITRAYIDVPPRAPLGPVRIESTYDYKQITFDRKSETRPWLHGINLRTYQMLGGAYPLPGDVADQLEAVTLNADIPHGDIQPWNFIMDGGDLWLIDGGDDRAIYDDVKGLAATVLSVRSME